MNMNAVVYTQYGPPEVLQYKEIPVPTPKDDEVLVKIHAASVNAADWHLLRADPFLARFFSGFWKPKFNILGADIAGTVEAVGKNVREFKPGDEVFGDVFSTGFGGYAEYVCTREHTLALKPRSVSFEDAAATPLAANTALEALCDRGKVREGMEVAINGASGGVGTFAVQIARHFGAAVTAICSTRNQELALSLGADHVIDYTKQNFSASGKHYDLIVAINGNTPIGEYKRALQPTGVYVMVGGKGKQMFQAMIWGPLLSQKGGKTLGHLSAKSTKKNLLVVRELLETGKIKPVIDKRFTLREVPDAIRYLEAGHAQGKVIIDVAGGR